MRHILDIKPMENVEIEYELAGSFGISENKRLCLTIKLTGPALYPVVSLFVESQGEKIYSGNQIKDAVEAYNNAEVRE